MTGATARRLPGGQLLVWAGLAGAIALLFAFKSSVGAMVAAWDQEEYSHGWIIPVLALLIAGSRLDALPNDGKVVRGFGGLACIGVALFLLVIGDLSTIYTLSQYGLLLGVVGLVWAALGLRAVLVLAGPLIYLAFMVPLPQFLYQGLSAKLQLISSELGVAAMRAMGIGVFLEGNIIDLGRYKLEVAEACSGLRYLFPLISFSYLGMLLMKDAWWKRAVVLLSAVPITIVMNSLRIAVIGLLVDRQGIAAAEGFIHLFEGWVVFVLCVALLLLEIQILLRIGTPGRFEPISTLWPRGESLARIAKGKVSRSLVIGIAALALAGVVGLMAAGRTETPPAHKPLIDFPVQLGSDWRGQERGLPPEALRVLHLTDYAQIDYRRPSDGGFVNFYLAYYASQRSGQAAHSPQACIPGGGWTIDRMEKRELSGIPGSPDGALTVNEVLIVRGGERQLVFYWFEQRGSVMTSEYVVKASILMDALTRNRTDGALVRLNSLILPDETEQDARERLTAFLKDAYPRIAAHVPR